MVEKAAQNTRLERCIVRRRQARRHVLAISSRGALGNPRDKPTAPQTHELDSATSNRKRSHTHTHTHTALTWLRSGNRDSSRQRRTDGRMDDHEETTGRGARQEDAVVIRMHQDISGGAIKGYLLSALLTTEFSVSPGDENLLERESARTDGSWDFYYIFQHNCLMNGGMKKWTTRMRRKKCSIAIKRERVSPGAALPFKNSQAWIACPDTLSLQ